MSELSTLKQKQLDFLRETVKYYSEDITRISVDEVGCCLYFNPGTGNKCAIGRYIPEDLYTRDIEYLNVDEYCVYKLLPEDLTSLGVDFLKRVQNLHDSIRYWTFEGLSPEGKRYVNELIIKILGDQLEIPV